MSTAWIIILLQGITFGGFSAWIAKQRNRDPLYWFILGLCFSLMALIAVAAAPARKERTNFLDDDQKKFRAGR